MIYDFIIVDTGEDKEQPKPYKTDLEYLEDNFEVILYVNKKSSYYSN